MCLEVPEAGLDITVVVLCILTITMNAHKQQLADSRSQQVRSRFSSTPS